MSEPGGERIPRINPGFTGPPKPRGRAARHDEAPARIVYLLDGMVVRDLAGALHLKPFKVVADLVEMKLFKSPDDTVDFETASRVARKHGYRAERPPPGVLVL